ncbi:ATP-binding protein [Streptomyces sp. NPDC012389]|uniref:ATP-binding protein n=1 Tax=Streptomyces sp. NPDC012389 TaxID=3364830 RepID=UPI0036E30077
MAESDTAGAPTTAGSAVRNTITGGSFGTSVQAGTITGGVHVHHQQPPTVVPRQLPPVPAHFTNRTAEARLLDEAWVGRRAGAPAMALLSGPGGAGKTALASSWGSGAADRFPDGQLYADLGGFRAEGPLESGQVLGGFLRALGVAPEQVPVDPAEQAALFRSLTAGSRLLVLLDNVTSEAQVAPLTPGSAGSMVLVTSRLRLAGVLARGGVLVEVAALSQEHAVELLVWAVGRARGDAEGAQVRDLAALCGRLPIALCVAGARLASRPRWPVSRIVRELADEQRRLDVLSAGEGMSVTSVFDVSYEGLSPRQARAYRRLALHPGPDFGLGAAAAVVELPAGEAADVLESLVDANVLEDRGTDRYRFHDLVRLHARGRAAAEDGDDEARAVTGRAAGHYLAVAVAAERTVMPGEWHVGLAYGSADGPHFASGLEVLDHLEGELPNLMAVLRSASGHGLDRLVWQLCEAMYALFLHRKHFPDWIAAYGMGIDAARRCGDKAARSRMHHRRGVAFHNLARSEEALREGEDALTAARAAGHDLAGSAALQLIGMASRALGRYDRSAEALRQAVELDHRAGQFRSEALAQRLLGSTYLAAGEVDTAVEALERACDLAEALTRAARPAEALALTREAWVVMADSGSSQYRARIMMAWGQAAEGLGDLPAARTSLLRARDFFTEAGVPDLRPVQEALNRVEAALADVQRNDGYGTA